MLMVSFCSIQMSESCSTSNSLVVGWMLCPDLLPVNVPDAYDVDLG